MKRVIGYIILAAALPVMFTTGCQKKNGENVVKMLSTVTAVGEKIEVEVIESEYAFGPYWVITDENTVFERGGRKIKRSDISAGDTVEIYYSGQVMLSYPPQIVAHRITVK
ncbi:MAG: DUF3221 domain-containing protein [Clostridia bacterium]|nr:DUF3221 domain-containing protein [Clostridia bacterium]